MLFGVLKSEPTFQRKMPPPSSEFKSKLKKKPAEKRAGKLCLLPASYWFIV
jgi:hypothetical protein